MEGGFLKLQENQEQQLVKIAEPQNRKKTPRAQKKRKYPSRGRISFSEMKIWNECAFKHKLSYLDNIAAFQGNEYTAFGTAIHSVCEHLITGKEESFNAEEHFEISFLSELIRIDALGVPLRQEMVTEMSAQAPLIFEHILPAVKEYFGEYEVISVEEPLFENITDFDSGGMKFKGFIDLVLKTADGKYHVIDWKSCSWGWDMKRKNDSITTYQLTLYKKFYASKFNVDEKDIETHFALLKRTAKKRKVEIFRVTSGERKTKNALKLLEKAVKNINKEIFFKNKTSCNRCDFKNTVHCP
jgi:ATP-dependent exoDNAse (exonuclease V) beta subunit